MRKKEYYALFNYLSVLSYNFSHVSIYADQAYHYEP